MPESDVKPVPARSWVHKIVPPFLATPERREQTANEGARALGTAAGVGVIAKFVPHQLGAEIARLGAGIHKSPATGKMSVGILFFTNLLPVPFGFVDPTTFGLPKNYYLPRGSSILIPRFVDRLGLGTAEQRAADESAAEAEQSRRFRATVDRLSRLDPARVREIAAGRPTAEEFRFFHEVYHVDRDTLTHAAQRQTGQSVNLTEALAQLMADVNKTFLPALVEPTNAAAKRSSEKAEGIRAELITEYADP